MKQKISMILAMIGALAVLTAPCGVFAQEGPPPSVVVTFSQQQLDQMLAPIALYPDSLLAQILLAATYPDQVMAASHWVREHQGLRGAALNDSLDGMAWDLSVKALVPFPQVLDMMAQQREWTQKLGEAFLAQQIQVMDSIQRLRRSAHKAGHLGTTAEQRVVFREDCIEVMSVNPEVVYVPRYNPAVVYGAWWWPAYPPFAYYPVWPGVVVAPVVGVFGFWGAVTVGPVWGWGWGSWGWHGHDVFLNVNRAVNINTVNGAGFRSSFQTTSLHQAVASGRFGAGSATWGGARAAAARNGVGGSAAGSHTGVAGVRGTASGARPSAGSVMRELRGGRNGRALGDRASHAGIRRAGAVGHGGRRGRFSRSGSFRRAGGARSSGGRRRSFSGGGRSFGGGRAAGGVSRGVFGRRGAGRSFGPQRASFGGRGGTVGGGFHRGGGSPSRSGGGGGARVSARRK